MRVETFSEYYAGQGGFVRGLDARVKILFSLACITFVISVSSILAPVLVGALCLATLIASGAPLKAVAVRISGPLVFASFLAVFQVFLAGGVSLTTFTLFGHALPVSAGGAAAGLRIIVRVFGAASAVLFLTMTTPAHRLLSAAARLKAPRGLVELSLFTYRYVFVLLEDAVTVYQAQRGRLGYTGLRRSLRSLGTLAGTVLLRAYGQAEATGVAMSLRGYTGEYVPESRERLRASDAFFLCSSLAVCTAVYVWTS